VASLTTEHFGVPSSAHTARALHSAGERAADEFGGRTVWCASALPDGRASAGALRGHLGRASDDGVVVERLEVTAGEPLTRLAERLDALLAGRAAGGAAARGELGPAEHELYEKARDGGEALAGDAVRADDVVVVHDALTAALAQPLRERGAHVVWHMTAPATLAEAWEFLGHYTDGLDAYLVTWRAEAGRGAAVDEVVALMPAAGAVAAKEVAAADVEAGHPSDIGWSCALAQVLRDDRSERVGGMLRPRPAVAAR
jgi:hypothetical protein